MYSRPTLQLEPSSRLRIAIQKSGKLAEGSVALLKKCGFRLQPGKNQLLVQDSAMNTDFIFSRDDDIPGFLLNGICDLGIFGSNLLAEVSLRDPAFLKGLTTIMPLGYARCRLSIAVPRDSPAKSIGDLDQMTIATSYPHLLQRFLRENQINCRIVTMHGSVELAPKIGIADGICDLVSSGATLRENGLREMTKVLDSEAVLVGNTDALGKDSQCQIARIMTRIRGILNADSNKYIMLHIDRRNLPLIREILPGCEAPTVLELQGIPDRIAVHVVSPEDIFWDTIEKLKDIGANSILVLPIEKMMD